MTLAHVIEAEAGERTYFVELFYSADQVRVAGGVLKVHVIWKRRTYNID